MSENKTVDLHAPKSKRVRELIALVAAVDKKKPDPKAVAELHRCLDTMPELCMVLGDTSFHLQIGSLSASSLTDPPKWPSKNEPRRCETDSATRARPSLSSS